MTGRAAELVRKAIERLRTAPERAEAVGVRHRPYGHSASLGWLEAEVRDVAVDLEAALSLATDHRVTDDHSRLGPMPVVEYVVHRTGERLTCCELCGRVLSREAVP